MTHDAAAPLFHIFDSGMLNWPTVSTRAVWIGAMARQNLPYQFGAQLLSVQGFRPDYIALTQQGMQVAPELMADVVNLDLALVTASRHRGETELRIAQAILALADGATLVIAGRKADGISSLRKRLAETMPMEGHMSKNHGEVLWLKRGTEALNIAAQTLAKQPSLVEGRFNTAPGMFSYDRVDAGSRLLAEYIPDNLSGHVADFCAGWGYLSVEVALRAPTITGIELFEADHAALNAARQNMAALAPKLPAQFHWSDLASEPVTRRFDAIVMNPPFHHGRATDPGIGQAMIKAASAALNAWWATLHGGKSRASIPTIPGSRLPFRC